MTWNPVVTHPFVIRWKERKKKREIRKKERKKGERKKEEEKEEKTKKWFELLSFHFLIQFNYILYKFFETQISTRFLLQSIKIPELYQVYVQELNVQVWRKKREFLHCVSTTIPKYQSVRSPDRVRIWILESCS